MNRAQHGTRQVALRDGGELSVRVAGQGPLAILMHGWPELGLSWRHQMDDLAGAGYTVAVPDMRGYGNSSKPGRIGAYRLDAMADDMADIAQALGASAWVAVGHDWGAPVAWRCANRFPDQVRGVFGLSVPYHAGPWGVPHDSMYPGQFFYIRYFQQVGRPERELERDPRAALKQIFFALSGDAPADAWIAPRPAEAPLLEGLVPAPTGALSFMPDAELDRYAEAFRTGGFFGPLSWYRVADAGYQERYGDGVIRQPAGFLCGEREIVLSMAPGALARQREACADLRAEITLPGAGHWIQQERPRQVSKALLDFLAGIDFGRC